MKFREAKYAVQWAIAVACGFVRFLVRNPKATRTTILWVLLNVHSLPRRLRYKSGIDKSRTQMIDELTECRRLFEQNEALKDCVDVEYLQQNHGSYGIKRLVLLYVLLRAAGCRSVVETGVAEGRSTSHILQALSDNGGGCLHSIDLTNQFYVRDDGKFHAEFNPVQEQPGCLVPQELKKYWKLTLGRSCDTLQAVLEAGGLIDVFFHDSAHTYETMTFEYEAAWPYMRPGGYLISDDATWSAAFIDFAERQGVKYVLIEGMGFIRKASP